MTGGRWLLASALLLTQCMGPAEGPERTYELARVAGKPLPAAIDAYQSTEGFHALEAVSGRMTFHADGRFTRTLVAQRVFNGVVTEPNLPGGFAGTYRWDSVVVLTFIDAQGQPGGVEYRILDGGRLLRGIEFQGAIYDWTLAAP